MIATAWSKRNPRIRLLRIMGFALCCLICLPLCSGAALANGGGAVPGGTGPVILATTAPADTPRPAADLVIDSDNLYEGMERTYSQGYSPSISNGVVSIVLPLIATNPLTNDTLLASINLGSVSDSPFVYGSYQQRVALGTQQVNGGQNTIAAYYVRFDVALSAERKNGVYPVEIEITATDLAGNALRKTFAAYVTIGDEKTTPQATQPQQSSGGSSGPTASKPVLVVSDCTTSAQTLVANEALSIRLVVKNVGRRTAHNIRAAITSDDENMILLNDYSAQYLRSLKSGKEETFSFEMQVLPQTLGGLRTLTITLNYESTDNVPFTETAVFRVNVEQPVMFSFDRIELPEKIVSGESFSVPVCVYNTGLSTMYNVKCALDVPGLIAASAFLGNLSPQQSADKMMLVFATTIDSTTRYGTTFGSAIISYEDAEGIVYEERTELKMEILEPPKQTDEEKQKEQEKAEEQETLSQWWVSLFFGFAIIAVLVATIIVYKFARLARMR